MFDFWAVLVTLTLFAWFLIAPILMMRRAYVRFKQTTLVRKWVQPRDMVYIGASAFIPGFFAALLLIACGVVLSGSVQIVDAGVLPEADNITISLLAIGSIILLVSLTLPLLFIAGLHLFKLAKVLEWFRAQQQDNARNRLLVMALDDARRDTFEDKDTEAAQHAERLVKVFHIYTHHIAHKMADNQVDVIKMVHVSDFAFNRPVFKYSKAYRPAWLLSYNEYLLVLKAIQAHGDEDELAAWLNLVKA